MHTRYSPVRRSPSKYCYLMLPLDLHVLSLPLAFILSQDQTLHCKNLFFYLFTKTFPWSHSKILTCSLDEIVNPAWLLLHNFKELLSAITLSMTDLFAFGTSKLMLLIFLSKKTETFFPAFSSSYPAPLLPTGNLSHLTLQPALYLKAGAKI